MQELKFRNSFGLELSIEKIVQEVVDFIAEDPTRTYKVIIGTDSELLSEKSADFVTALVVHRIGNGGRYFWRHITGDKYYTIRDRIIQEVMFSLESAKILLERLERETIETYWGFEIHADIGENGPSRELIQEVVGMIRANNFEARTKPESYAASKVADRHC